MSQMIDALESRVLLTASSTSLAAELAAVNASANAIKVDLKALVKSPKLDLVALSKDIKGTAKSNATLLKKAVTDEAKFIARLNADMVALSKSTTVSKTAAADGNAVLKAPTNAAAGAKIQLDVTALTSVATKPLAKFQLDAIPTQVDADLDALAAANTGNATIAAHVATAKTNLNHLISNLNFDAVGVNNAVAALRTDLTSLLPALTTSPSLVGDYQGTFKTKPVAFGVGSISVPFEIKVTSETISTVTGSISAAGNSASGTITKTELTTGKVTFKISNSDLTVNLVGVTNINTTKTGQAPGNVITGEGTVTVAGYKISGTFQVIKVT